MGTEIGEVSQRRKLHVLKVSVPTYQSVKLVEYYFLRHEINANLKIEKCFIYFRTEENVPEQQARRKSESQYQRAKGK